MTTPTLPTSPPNVTVQVRSGDPSQTGAWSVLCGPENPPPSKLQSSPGSRNPLPGPLPVRSTSGPSDVGYRWVLFFSPDSPSGSRVRPLYFWSRPSPDRVQDLFVPHEEPIVPPTLTGSQQLVSQIRRHCSAPEPTGVVHKYSTQKIGCL